MRVHHFRGQVYSLRTSLNYHFPAFPCNCPHRNSPNRSRSLRRRNCSPHSPNLQAFVEAWTLSSFLLNSNRVPKHPRFWRTAQFPKNSSADSALAKTRWIDKSRLRNNWSMPIRLSVSAAVRSWCVEIQDQKRIDYLLQIGEKMMGVNPKLAQNYLYVLSPFPSVLEWKAAVSFVRDIIVRLALFCEW